MKKVELIFFVGRVFLAQIEVESIFKEKPIFLLL